jgi:hypothetical protein
LIYRYNSEKKLNCIPALFIYEPCQQHGCVNGPKQP